MSEFSMGIILGNRDFFPDELIKKSRDDWVNVFKKHGIKPIILGEREGAYGSVQDFDDAKKCARLFKNNQEKIRGIIVSLPNFGDEKSIVEAVNRSGLDVPILVQAYPDEPDKLDIDHRRDSFCGKISVCNNFDQSGINFSLTREHVVNPDSDSFEEDLRRFISIVKITDQLKEARIGVVGTRPADFNTVRFSEKILQVNNISVEPIGLVKILERAKDLEEKSKEVTQGLKEIKSYVNTDKVPESSLIKIAKLHSVLTAWVEEQTLDAIAIQCWDSIQKYFGVNVCTIMSILSNQGIPSACEADACGALSMLALQAASGNPSALVDWNNNYGKELNKAIIFHCSNFPKDLCSNCQMNYANVLATTLGQENTYGSLEGKLKPGKVTFTRISTDDRSGEMRAYLTEGKLLEETADTFGGSGVVNVPQLQKLMYYICSNGFEHHVAVNYSSSASALEEALGKYLNWKVYNHTK